MIPLQKTKLKCGSDGCEQRHQGWNVTYAITIDTLIRPRLTKFKTEA